MRWKLHTTLVIALAAGALYWMVNDAQASKIPTWHKTGGSVFTDSVGKWSSNLWGQNSVAELGMGCAMGCLGGHRKLKLWLPRTHRSTYATILDIGSGGGSVSGYPRAIDIHCRTLRALGLNDCDNWTGVVHWRFLKKTRRKR